MASVMVIYVSKRSETKLYLPSRCKKNRKDVFECSFLNYALKTVVDI